MDIFPPATEMSDYGLALSLVREWVRSSPHNYSLVKHHFAARRGTVTRHGRVNVVTSIGDHWRRKRYCKKMLHSLSLTCKLVQLGGKPMEPWRQTLPSPPICHKRWAEFMHEHVRRKRDAALANFHHEALVGNSDHTA